MQIYLILPKQLNPSLISLHMRVPISPSSVNSFIGVKPYLLYNYYHHIF